MAPATHWDRVYQTRVEAELSWFQQDARLSLELILRHAPDRATPIVDVGSGTSRLTDALLDAGYTALTLNDCSQAALDATRTRLGARASAVGWRVGNVLTADFTPGEFGVWHDRAVFHFQVSEADRARYVAQLRHALRAGGCAIVATFAEDGPERCSGLEVRRYSAEQLHRELGDGLALVESRREVHTTPAGARQPFTYCVLRRDG